MQRDWAGFRICVAASMEISWASIVRGCLSRSKCSCMPATFNVFRIHDELKCSYPAPIHEAMPSCRALVNQLSHAELSAEPQPASQLRLSLRPSLRSWVTKLQATYTPGASLNTSLRLSVSCIPLWYFGTSAAQQPHLRLRSQARSVLRIVRWMRSQLKAGKRVQ
jgi:hypothetical protein